MIEAVPTRNASDNSYEEDSSSMQARPVSQTEKENDVNKNCCAKFLNGRAYTTIAFGLLLAFVLGVAGMASAQESTNLKFRSAIGVIPVTGVGATGVATLNVVRAVNPAGPWRIADLSADVSYEGQIRVKGRGLLLAAGNGIGTNAGASVFATLFCGDAKTATAHNTNPVALDADGDFRIDELLSPVPPTSCETPVLLIRNASGAGVWFAASTPELK